jgi:hypothetical protein
MEVRDWKSFWSNRWILSYLTDLRKKLDNKLYLIPINIQIKIIILKLCINRNPMSLPRELWNLICENISNDVKYFCNKKYVLDDDIYIKSEGTLKLFNVSEYKIMSQLENNNELFDITYHFDLSRKRIRGKKINDLEKYIKIGQLGTSGCCRCDYEPYIIVDINYEYHIVSIIKISAYETYTSSDPGLAKTIYIPRKSQIIMYTYEDFVHMGTPSDVHNYVYDLAQYDIMNILPKPINSNIRQNNSHFVNDL